MAIRMVGPCRDKRARRAPVSSAADGHRSPLWLPRWGYRRPNLKPAMAVLTRPDPVIGRFPPPSSNSRRQGWWSPSMTRPRRGQGGSPWGLARAGNHGRTNSSRECKVSSTTFALAKVSEIPMLRGARRSGTTHAENARSGSHNDLRPEVSPEVIEMLKTAHEAM